MKPSQLNLRQVFALVLAESRGAWRRMLFFILCIAIGVGAVMTVKSFSNLVGESIQGQAKGLLSADLAIKGSWEQTLEDLDYQEKILPPETEFLFIKELHGMAQFKNPKTGKKLASLITELKAVPLTGLIVAKLDGTSKGGMGVAIHNELQLPVKFIGLGEQPDDLQPFDAEKFAEALFAE